MDESVPLPKHSQIQKEVMVVLCIAHIVNQAKVLVCKAQTVENGWQ